MWASRPPLAVQSSCEWTLQTHFGGIQMKLMEKRGRCAGHINKTNEDCISAASSLQRRTACFPLLLSLNIHHTQASVSASNCKWWRLLHVSPDVTWEMLTISQELFKIWAWKSCIAHGIPVLGLVCRFPSDLWLWHVSRHVSHSPSSLLEVKYSPSERCTCFHPFFFILFAWCDTVENPWVGESHRAAWPPDRR